MTYTIALLIIILLLWFIDHKQQDNRIERQACINNLKQAHIEELRKQRDEADAKLACSRLVPANKKRSKQIAELTEKLAYAEANHTNECKMHKATRKEKADLSQKLAVAERTLFITEHALNMMAGKLFLLSDDKCNNRMELQNKYMKYAEELHGKDYKAEQEVTHA